MKSNSTVFPNKFHKSQNLIYINDVLDVTETTKDNTTTYEYSTYELTIVDRDNLEEYITDNYDVLLAFAKNNAKDISVQPKQIDVEKARQEESIINLLVDLGVLE